MIAALRGGVTFLTRLPVRSRDGDWEAFRRTPAVFSVVGLLVGALASLPLLAAGAVPAPSVALGYLLAVYALTGIHHVDGVADCGDGLAVHGDADRRLAAMGDTTTGVGGTLAVSVVVVGLALGGLGLAGLPVAAAVGVAVAAEVGAKVGMAAMACLGTAAHEGLGSSVTAAVGPVAFVGPAAIAAPVVALTWPQPAAAAALGAAVLAALVPWLWAVRRLGGVTGDVFGAVNELGRLVGVHAGVIAWALW